MRRYMALRARDVFGASSDTYSCAERLSVAVSGQCVDCGRSFRLLRA